MYITPILYIICIYNINIYIYNIYIYIYIYILKRHYKEIEKGILKGNDDNKTYKNLKSPYMSILFTNALRTIDILF